MSRPSAQETPERPAPDPESSAARSGLVLDAARALLVALLAVLACFGAVDGGFVLDDASYVVNNEAVVGDASPFAAPTPPDRPELGLYRPLTVATYRWQYLRDGLDPRAFRAFNVALHALASALVYLAARRLGLAGGAALFAGAAFACHPVHAESVAWIVGRAEVLATIFALLAILARPKASSPSPARWLLCAGCYAAAAAAKESALALPLALVLLDRFEGASWSSAARRALLLAAVAAALLAARVAILGRFAPDVAEHPVLGGLGIVQRLELGVRVLGFAVEHLAVPHHLSIYYEPREIAGAWRLVAGVVAAIGLAAATWPRAALPIRAGAALLLSGLLPVLHLVPIGWLFGDRFLYLPSVGFVLIVAGCARGIGSRALRIVLGVGLVGAAFALCAARVPVYSSDLALWRDAVEKDPASGFAHHQLAGFLRDEGRLEYVSDAEKGAVHHWTEALRVDPVHPHAARTHVELGNYALSRLRDARSAADHYRAAIALDPEAGSDEGVDARLALAAIAVTEAFASIVTEAEAVAALRALENSRLDRDRRAIARGLVDRLANSSAFADGGTSAAALAERFAPL